MWAIRHFSRILLKTETKKAVEDKSWKLLNLYKQADQVVGVARQTRHWFSQSFTKKHETFDLQIIGSNSLHFSTHVFSPSSPSSSSCKNVPPVSSCCFYDVVVSSWSSSSSSCSSEAPRNGVVYFLEPSPDTSKRPKSYTEQVMILNPSLFSVLCWC